MESGENHYFLLFSPDHSHRTLETLGKHGIYQKPVLVADVILLCSKINLIIHVGESPLHISYKL